MVQCSDSVCGEEKENHFYGFQMHTFGRKPLAFSSLQKFFPHTRGPMHSTESLKDYSI